MKRTAREVALRVLCRVEAAGLPADQLLSAEIERAQLIPQDKALCMELVMGVLRWKGRLDWALAHHLDFDLNELTPWIRNALRMGTYQLLFLTRVPPSAAVDESVKLAKRFGHRGTAALVNAVLRNLAEKGRELPPEDEPLESELSHPLWLINRWTDRYGLDKTREICLSNNRVPPLTVRANILKLSAEDAKAALKDEGVEAEPCLIAPEGLKLSHRGDIKALSSFARGFFQVQDEASMLVSHIVHPKPGHRVLDCCAGMGVKATHLAQMMKNEGEIVAWDINGEKLDLLQENCRRLGVTIVRSAPRDATRAEGLEGAFDSVLVDAPCTGFGVIRRNPDIKWNKGEKSISEMNALQSALLENVSRTVRRGGILVYAVCSNEPEETGETVERFLKNIDGFSLSDPSGLLPESARPFVKADGSFEVLAGQEEMDGFYVARMMRH